MQQDWLMALYGGILIGIAAAVMLFFNGRIMGVSGIFNGLFRFQKNDVFWRVSFILGMLIGGMVIYDVNPSVFDQPDFKPVRLIFAGLLVGIGTAMSSGCTSGHGICGITRLSLRSLVATICFVGFGVLSVYVIKHLLGTHL